MAAKKKLAGLDPCKFCGEDIPWSPKTGTGVGFSTKPRTYAHIACYERWGWHGPTEEELLAWRRRTYPEVPVEDFPVDFRVPDAQ